ncbi:hypothetical protein [Pontibacter saemangeumensis]|uniref:hypothetical protein n=1 Tax=Pontibacter saemangeumensis TaxID=1084525 RepID=UPI0031E9AD44
MTNFAIVATWVAIIGMIGGVLSPKKSLFWYMGEKTRINAFIIYSFLLLLSFILFALTE